MVSMKFRPKTASAKTNVPGPGSYNPTLRQSGHASKIGTS